MNITRETEDWTKKDQEDFQKFLYDQGSVWDILIMVLCLVCPFIIVPVMLLLGCTGVYGFIEVFADWSEVCRPISGVPCERDLYSTNIGEPLI